MRIFVSRWFDRFARKEKIFAGQIADAINRAERGLVDADLGGGLIKQRVPRAGQGRSGGFRTIVAYRKKDRAVFLYGFAKNERDNIDDDDMNDLKRTAGIFLAFDRHAFQVAVEAGDLREIIQDG